MNSRYDRAYRDPKSPLTPITPLTTHAMFDFESATTPLSHPSLVRKGSLLGKRPSQRGLSESSHHSASSKRSLNMATRFSKEFMRKRAVFSPSQSTKMTTTKTKIKITSVDDEKKPTANIKREFKQSSPVKHPPLSPRVSTLLRGMDCNFLTEIFTRNEISVEVLLEMTAQDFETLGMRGSKEIKSALEVIKFAKQLF